MEHVQDPDELFVLIVVLPERESDRDMFAVFIGNLHLAQVVLHSSVEVEMLLWHSSVVSSRNVDPSICSQLTNCANDQNLFCSCSSPALLDLE